MKISLDEYSRVLQLSRTGRVGAAVLPAPALDDAQEGLSPAATVELSPRAQQIRQIKFILDEIPEVREEIVQELRRKIEAGEYNVSSAEIADLIVRRTVADNVR
ncbi:MAG: flagellar biosynthesis anti-sigma factor FlgM [Armatimonadota bacterium]